MRNTLILLLGASQAQASLTEAQGANDPISALLQMLKPEEPMSQGGFPFPFPPKHHSKHGKKHSHKKKSHSKHHGGMPFSHPPSMYGRPPMYGGSSHHAPMYGGPSRHPPMYGGPSHHAPMYGGSSHHAPMYGGSSHHAPMYGGSSHHAPSHHAPMYGMSSYRPPMPSHGKSHHHKSHHKHTKSSWSSLDERQNFMQQFTQKPNLWGDDSEQHQPLLSFMHESDDHHSGWNMHAFPEGHEVNMKYEGDDLDANHHMYTMSRTYDKNSGQSFTHHVHHIYHSKPDMPPMLPPAPMQEEDGSSLSDLLQQLRDAQENYGPDSGETDGPQVTLAILPDDYDYDYNTGSAESGEIGSKTGSQEDPFMSP